MKFTFKIFLEILVCLVTFIPVILISASILAAGVWLLYLVSPWTMIGTIPVAFVIWVGVVVWWVLGPMEAIMDKFS